MAEYQCAHCGGSLTSAWPDDAARKEAQKHFDRDLFDWGPVAVVCDDCYRRLMEWAEEDDC